MNDSMNIGNRIKQLRTKQKMSLRQLGEKTGLSIGFLSQLEREMTTVAVDSLQNIANALSVDLSYFFTVPQANEKGQVIRSYERPISLIESDKFVHSYLSSNLSRHRLFPEIITIVPDANANVREEHEAFRHTHEGEEFLYVIEGTLTVILGNESLILHAEDSLLFHSENHHNWYNETNRIVKILVVHYPSPYYAQPPQP